MRKRLKAVVDTNVFISALIGSKNCKFIYEELKADSFDLVVSLYLLLEIERVITRGNFELAEGEVVELLDLLKRKGLRVSIREKIKICRDPKDNFVLECAIAGSVDYIITGDKDLLVLSPFCHIPIITPSEFSKVLLSGRK